MRESGSTDTDTEWVPACSGVQGTETCADPPGSTFGTVAVASRTWTPAGSFTRTRTSASPGLLRPFVRDPDPDLRLLARDRHRRHGEETRCLHDEVGEARFRHGHEDRFRVGAREAGLGVGRAGHELVVPGDEPDVVEHEATGFGREHAQHAALKNRETAPEPIVCVGRTRPPRLLRGRDVHAEAGLEVAGIERPQEPAVGESSEAHEAQPIARRREAGVDHVGAGLGDAGRLGSLGGVAHADAELGLVGARPREPPAVRGPARHGGQPRLLVQELRLLRRQVDDDDLGDDALPDADERDPRPVGRPAGTGVVRVAAAGLGHGARGRIHDLEARARGLVHAHDQTGPVRRPRVVGGPAGGERAHGAVREVEDRELPGERCCSGAS